MHIALSAFRLGKLFIAAILVLPSMATADQITDLYSSISAQEAKFPLPTSDATVTVAQINLSPPQVRNPDGTPLPAQYIAYLVPDYLDGTYVQSPPCKGPILQFANPPKPSAFIQPGFCPERQPNVGASVTVANIKNLSLRFLITGWPANYPAPAKVSITLGDQTVVANAGQSEILIPIAGQTNLPLSIALTGAVTANGTAKTISVAGILPVTINRLVVGVGAFSLPALPVSIIYAPPVDSQSKNQSTASNSVSLGNTSTLAFSSQNGTTIPISPNFENIVDMEKDMSVVGAALSKSGNPVATAIGGALTFISSGLGSSTATISTVDAITAQHALTVSSTSTMSQTAYSSQGGPGKGDLISYYYNARVVWYSKNQMMQLAIIGYDGFVQATAQQLSSALKSLQSKPAGTVDPEMHVDAATLSSILALDPFVAGGQTLIPDPKRFTQNSPVLNIDGGLLSYLASKTIVTTDLNSTAHTVTKVNSDAAGFLSFLGLGVTDTSTTQVQTTLSSSLQSSVGKTLTQQVTLFGDGKSIYQCQIYFDNVFGTFAFRFVDPKLSTVKIAGIAYGNNNIPLANATVLLSRADRSYLTMSDASGAFAFRLPDLGSDEGGAHAWSEPDTKILFDGKPATYIQLNNATGK